MNVNCITRFDPDDGQRRRSMRRNAVPFLCLAVTLFQGCSLFERKPAADTPERAARTAYLVCDGCHGPRDIRMDTMPPNIIGQKERYLAAKLKDYRAGKRVHPWMNGVTRNLTDQDIANLAAYFSQRGRMN
jgi:cytochrome c553